MSVYFITAREVGRVKIGYSCDPISRFQKMRTESPVKIALERVSEGGRDYEAELLDRFADQRVHGEWFTLTSEIEAFMETFAAGPHVNPPGKGRRRAPRPFLPACGTA